MPRMPILANDSNPPTCLPDSSLPNFYMADYTVLGIRVRNLSAAIRLLEKNRITLLKKGGAILKTNGRLQHSVPAIFFSEISKGRLGQKNPKKFGYREKDSIIAGRQNLLNLCVALANLYWLHPYGPRK